MLMMEKQVFDVCSVHMYVYAAFKRSVEEIDQHVKVRSARKCMKSSGQQIRVNA